MVGLTRLGEVAHALETVRNLWLRLTRPVTPALFDLLTQSQTHFRQWLTSLRTQAAEPDIQTLLQQAQTVGQAELNALGATMPFSLTTPDMVHIGSVVISAAIEAEVAQLPAEDQGEYLSSLGLKETGLARVVRAGYELLDLVTFFTVGPKEARAWTVRREARAPEAAGVIHTDFEKGFIRAETIAFDDYVTLNGEAGARDAGKLRLEGKEYVVKDGDVFHFRFNV